MNWWAVYTPKDERVALVKHAEDAAALVAVLGAGYTIRSGRKVVLWTEGEEMISAAESYDEVASVVMRRFYEARLVDDPPAGKPKLDFVNNRGE